MNIGSLGKETVYGAAAGAAAKEKYGIWKKQSGDFVKNDAVQEDMNEKIGGDPERKEKSDRIVGEKVSGGDPGKWSLLADDEGMITYNGVLFLFDSESNELCLGDMSQTDNVLSIPLSRGGTLRVNRNNIDDLSKAIGMFSPEDINRIMRAIAEDAHCRRKLNEIEDDKNSLGEEQDAADDTEEAKETPNAGNFHDTDNFNRAWKEYFKGADRSVERIWKETMEETGVDGFGYNGKGMLSHITQFQIARLTMKQRETSVFGTTVESALDFARKSLYSLSNPLVPLSERPENVRAAIMDERRFYEKFIEKLSLL